MGSSIQSHVLKLKPATGEVRVDAGYAAWFNLPSITRWRIALACLVQYVVFPLDVLLLLLETVENSSKSTACGAALQGLALFGVTLALMELAGLQKTLSRTQSWLIIGVRDVLGVKALSQSDGLRWSESIAANYWCILPAGLVLSFMDYVRGQNRLSLLNLRFVLYGVVAAEIGTEDAVRHSINMQVCFQILTLSLVPDGFSMSKRGMFARSVCNFMLQDDMARMLSVYVPLMFCSGDFVVPLGSTLFIVAVMDVLGIRPLVAQTARMLSAGPFRKAEERDESKENEGKEQRSIALVTSTKRSVIENAIILSSCIVPLHLMAAVFYPRDYKLNETRCIATLTFASLVAAGLPFAFRDSIERSFRHSLASIVENADKATFSIARIFAWGLSFGALVRSSGWLGTSVCSIIVLITYLSARRWTDLPIGTIMWRLLLLFHAGQLACCAVQAGASSEFSLSIVLTLARCIAALDRPVFISECISGLAILCAVTMLHLHFERRDNSNATAALTNAFATMVAVLLVSSSTVFQESQLRLIVLASQSSQFLDHAIKQRYAAVGAALEQLADVPGLKAKAPSVFSTARTALTECHAGRDMCHLSTYTRKLLIDPTLPAACALLNVQEMVLDWIEEQVFGDIQTVREEEGWTKDIWIRIDQDLLRALLCSMSSDPRRSSLTVRLVSTRQIQFKIQALKGQSWSEPNKKLSVSSSIRKLIFSGDVDDGAPGVYLRTMRDRIALAFRARVDEDCVILPAEDRRDVTSATEGSPIAKYSPIFRLRSLWSSRKDSLPPPTSSREFSLEFLPPGLVFAILDDVKIMRNSLLNLCLNQALGDRESSFAQGATRAEALLFPHCVTSKTDRSVDLIIIDENLEYPEGLISGTVIARQIRARGFDRCLVLHSANGHLRETLDYGCFDGFVEKTSKREEFIRGLLRAWQNYDGRPNLHSKVE